MAYRDSDVTDTRTTQLQAMLAARTDGQGKPRPGYVKNVRAIHAEIRRLKTSKNPVEAPRA